MKKICLILVTSIAVTVLHSVSVWAFSAASGNLNADLAPWPAVTVPPVVEFEARIGNYANDGVWETGLKFGGNYLETNGQYAWPNSSDVLFSLRHDSPTGEFSLQFGGDNGTITTWNSGRPCQAVKEIWIQVLTANDRFQPKVKNLRINNGTGTVPVTWAPGNQTILSTSSPTVKKYLRIDGELFENFYLLGLINFEWFAPFPLSPPSPNDMKVLVSVVFADNQDQDGDGVGDVCDNCATTPNTNQADCNNNGIGNVCDVINPGAIETCDNIDNNCNGSIDENLSQDTTCGVGECSAAGIEICIAGEWVGDSCIPGSPTDESCDNRDNDCDGSIDEDLTQATICGVGECAATGIETCAAGVWGGDTCVAGTPSAETCDNLDNNCDGNIDESLSRPTACGIGACAGNTGIETCTAGIWGGDTCDPQAGAVPEVCDGVDNDCDMQVDEEVKTTFYLDADGDNYGDLMNGVEECSTPVGYVADNTDCNDDDFNINPSITETCDTIDNNCNSEIDEGCPADVQLQNAGTSFDTIQNAYFAIQAGNIEIMKIQALMFQESVSLDSNVSVTIKGGYNGLWEETPRGYSTISNPAGPAMIIINGTVIIDNIILM